MIALVAVVAVALLTSAALSGAAAQTGDPQTLDDLFDLFGVSDVPADFVIVIDTSGSMSEGPNPPYLGVLQAYRSLIDAIPNGDAVSVVTFDSDPNLVFQGPLDAKSRVAAKAALPESATGAHTDIGAALDATLRRLERADSSDVETVIFLTDGVHDPPEGSAFPEKSGPAWEELRARAQRVAQTHDLLVLGIGVASGTDIGLLRTVFANPEINSLPPDQLPAFFAEAIRRSRLARLRLLVDRELEHGVRVRSTATAPLAPSIESDIALTSNFTKLPVTVDVSGVKVTDRNGTSVPATVVGPESVRLGPGETARLSILIKPEVSTPRFTVPPKTESAEFTIEIDATYTVQPVTLLQRVTPHPVTGTVTGFGTVETSRTFGWTIRRAVTLLLLVLLILWVLVWLYRRFLQLPRLVGVFELDMAGLDEDQRVLRLRGKRMILDQSNVPLAGTAKVKLFTRRGRRGHVWASVEQPPFFEVVDRRRERQVIDETEIRFGDYRLAGGRLQYRARARTKPRRRRARVGGAP